VTNLFLLQGTTVSLKRAAKIGLFFKPPSFSEKTRLFLFAITFCQPAKNIPFFIKAGCKDKSSFRFSKSFSPLIIPPSPEMLYQQGL